MNPIPLHQIEAQFGPAFTSALRCSMGLDDNSAETVEAWNVGQAKDHFSEVLGRVRNGECQLVRRRSEEPVLMMSIAQLAEFVELASPKRRFADLIAPDPAFPVGHPLSISEAQVGHDRLDL